jgi:hypothetical protein
MDAAGHLSGLSELFRALSLFADSESDVFPSWFAEERVST